MHQYDFIREIAPHAQSCHRKTGVYASCIIAQAALESCWGKKVPEDHKTKKCSYNLFGIKGEGPCGHVNCPHMEYENGRKVWHMAKFRCYHNYKQSIEDHCKLMMAKRYKPVREACSADEAAHQLYKCGYATDPKYAEKLISIMKRYNLYEYDID
ncbi:flagellum-specific peptidoglycan hydrolase FlgJ [Desulfohalotomaculum tongense]|uniref:glycoside hydrolase family 73 protein n=1 Tax=Desulforadius tongensis TaxID=1216062 RepID=UPI0019590BF7|nr:glucosaminidase domain-containing protein [Desulforadius tongensis]MBM7853963.1 flagellum-specific peptidoglycan hydrolase FlgJ [Desulforadius tongensis]